MESDGLIGCTVVVSSLVERDRPWPLRDSRPGDTYTIRAVWVTGSNLYALLERDDGELFSTDLACFRKQQYKEEYE